MATDKEWFGEWFNSPYYHVLYKKRDFKEAEAFISNLAHFLKIPQKARVLDLACGKGRHAVYLNKLGFEVTGLDLSQESIKYAKQFESTSLHFATHDMRFPLPSVDFDFIFNLFTSFGYFDSEEENQQAINSMSNGLKRNGHLIIDFLNAEKVTDTLVPFTEMEEEGIVFTIKREIKQGFILKHISFSQNQQPYTFTEKVKAINETDFMKYLTFAGLKVVKKFGDYELNKFDSSTSDRLILIAKKS